MRQTHHPVGLFPVTKAGHANPESASTGDLLVAAARSLRRSYAERMSRWDITPGVARALRHVVDLGSPRLTALADRLRIAPRSATEVVDALESRQLVQRRPDPADRRAITIVATPTGTQMYAVLEKARAEAAEDFLSRLSASDRSTLDAILRRLLSGE